MSYRGLSLEERIERLSIPEPMSGCYLWLGSFKTNPAGIQYGRFSLGTRTVAAHRIAFEVFRGPIPAGMNVCHTCDVGLCVNPDHLFLGSQKQNVADAVRKGRMRCGMMSDRYGEDWPTAKLSNADVVAIRKSKGSHRAVAVRFGISKSYTREIRLGLARVKR